jgi:outer membrane protein assembly factor BamB
MRLCALVLSVALTFAAASETGARPAKGDGPTAVTAGFGALWVGTGRGELFRVDPRTGQARKWVRKEPGQIGHVASVAAARGAVWLSDAGLGVARVDPRRLGRPRVVFPSHGSLASDGRSLWAANPWREQVLRIDPTRARVVASVRVPGRLVNISAGPAGAYVVYAPTSGPLTGPAGVRRLQRLDPLNARLVGEPASFDCDLTVGVGRKALWTVDFCTWTVARRDPRTLAVRVERASPRTATFATLGFGSIWVSGGSRLFRFDATTLRVQTRLWVRGSAAAAGEGGIWILDGSLIHKLDPRTNRIVRTFRVPG